MAHVLLIGNGAREHAIAEAIMRSRHNPVLYSYMKSNNPGIAQLSEQTCLGSYADLAEINGFAQKHRVDFAVIGPEDPLSNGVVDTLSAIGVPSVGPSESLARLETSKAFARGLLKKYKIPGNPRFKTFATMAGCGGLYRKARKDRCKTRWAYRRKGCSGPGRSLHDSSGRH